MNIQIELRESAILPEKDVYSLVLESSKQFNIRLTDVLELQRIAEEHNIAPWQVVSVATNRLRKDLEEHRQQVLMGV